MPSKSYTESGSVVITFESYSLLDGCAVLVGCAVLDGCAVGFCSSLSIEYSGDIDFSSPVISISSGKSGRFLGPLSSELD